MMVMILVAAAATMLATHYGFRARLVSQEARRIHLVALTDAAVAEALANLSDNSYFGGMPMRDFGGGRIASEIGSLPDERRTILATASYRGWTRKVRVQICLKIGSIEVESWATLPPQ